jgi:hypothetical protein
MNTKEITKKEVLNDYTDINIQLHWYWLKEQGEDELPEYPDDQDYFLDEEYEKWCKKWANQQ